MHARRRNGLDRWNRRVVLGRARAELYQTVPPHLGDRSNVGVGANRRRVEEAPRRNINSVLPQIVV